MRKVVNLVVNVTFSTGPHVRGILGRLRRVRRYLPGRVDRGGADALAGTRTTVPISMYHGRAAIEWVISMMMGFKSLSATSSGDRGAMETSLAAKGVSGMGFL